MNTILPRPLARRALLMALLSLSITLPACGSDTAATGGSGGGGSTTSTTAFNWEAYCADTYCPLRDQQADATGCKPDPNCYQSCLAQSACQSEVMAVAECSKTAKLACEQISPVEPSRVALALGECVSALNAHFACLYGPCDTTLDGACAPIACPNGTFATLCRDGTCVEDPSVVCATTTACSSGDFFDVCPSLVCDGGNQQSCTPGGVCKVACD